MTNTKNPRWKDSLTLLEKHSHLYLIPIILLIIYLMLAGISSSYEEKSRTLRVGSSYPQRIIEYPYFNSQVNPFLSAEAAIIKDVKTGTVLFQKNSEVRFSMASTTKVMTALTGLDYFQPTSVLTARRSNVEGVNVGLKIGEEMYFKDALYALMLPSGNDVAYLIADNYPGGMNAFISAMNNKAQSFDLYNTHYADPAGLNDDGNYTTAADLSRLGMFAMNDATLSQVMGTKSSVVTTVNKSHVFPVSNLNQFLGIYGVVGGKTGYTEGAEGVLLTIAKIKNRDYIVVVMRSDDRFLDTQNLLLPLQNGVGVFNPR